MKQLLEQLPQARAFTLASLIDAQPGQTVSKTLLRSDAGLILLYALAPGEAIAPHHSDGAGYIACLDGEGIFQIDEQAVRLQAGQSLVMPAGHVHAVKAETTLKMLLVLAF